MSSSHSVYCTLSACLLHTGMQYCMNSNKTLIRTDFFSKYYNVHDIQSIQSITTHTFNGPLSRTTRVSRYQKGKTNLDFTEARDSEWQWHQLGHMQSASRSRQRTTPAPHHSVFYRLDALPAAQPTASKHWRQSISTNKTKYGSTF